MSDDENDQSDEDVAYHELFENAQKAIHSSEANQRRSKAVREELEAYIDRASEMKGSDGSTLIRIPSNFETIVNSMNRDDLSAETSEEKPWSQYLLLDGLNAEDDKEYNGRYTRSFRDTPDVKIKRGLAQIQLLDRQLQEITRATHAENETGSPRADETFITTKHARGTDELSPVAKIEVQRGHLGAQSKKTTNKFNIEKEREQQRLTYLLSVEPDDEKGAESYWDPDLQAANEAIDERLAAFGRWGRGSTTTATAEADNIDPAGDVDRAEAPAAETTLNEATTGDGGGNNKRERKVDYLHELRAVRLENERMQRLDALIDTCSNHPIEYEALLPKAPPVTSYKQNPASSSKSSPRAASSPLGTGRRSIITSIIATSSGSNVAGDVLAVPDPAEVLPERVVTYEDIQELIAFLSGGEAFPTGAASSSAVSPSSSAVGGYAFPHAAAHSTPSHGAAPRVVPPPTTPAGSSATVQGGVMTHNIVDKEGIKALVRQHKKDIEALGRLRARYHSNGLATNDQEEWSATAVGDAKKEDDGQTQCSTADDNDDDNKKNKNADNDERVERWLDWNEEVPASTINAAHRAVAATAAATGSARKPRVVVGGSGSNSSSGSAVAEQLPPIPQLSSHTTVSEEGIRIIPEHLIQSSKSQSAALATDYEDSISPRAAAVSPRPVGAISAVKKSLRLPRGLLNAQLTATNSSDAGGAGAGAGADLSRHGLTVFRSINSELERQQLQQHAANGARLVKKIGAVLAAERDTTTTHLHHNNRHMPHHHHQRQKDQQQHQQQQQRFGESAEHLSPSSARRALKARNVLDSMTASSSTASSATTTIIPSSSRTNPLSSPSGTIATPTTRDAAYSDVMRI